MEVEDEQQVVALENNNLVLVVLLTHEVLARRQPTEVMFQSQHVLVEVLVYQPTQVSH